jgi:hypothetical protein
MADLPRLSAMLESSARPPSGSGGPHGAAGDTGPLALSPNGAVASLGIMELMAL